MLQFWSKRHENFFNVNFRPFPADSYGVEQNSSFLATFFSSACNFGQQCKLAKNFGRPDQQIRSRLCPKQFSCMCDKYWRIHMGSMGGEKPGFPPLQIPIPISFKSAQGVYIQLVGCSPICRKMKQIKIFLMFSRENKWRNFVSFTCPQNSQQDASPYF